MKKIRVGILGATGMVGQQFVLLLQDHPWFEITALAASEKSAGKPYAEAVQWVQSEPLPEAVADLPVQEARPDLPCEVVFSGLDASAAESIERAFADAGYAVISNARNYRMHPQVPLLVPEVNPNHIELIRHQREGRPERGFIVTNPNCSTTGLVLGVLPLWRRFGIRRMLVNTLQAVSGAGFPGLPAMQMLGNVLPHIRGEAEKIQTEPLKLFGSLEGDRVQAAEIQIGAQCNRVPVLNGHLISVSLELRQQATHEAVQETLRQFVSPLAEWYLPSAPPQPVRLVEDPFAPQPARDLMADGGMTVTVGQLAPCPVLDYRLVILVHNTIRGAAGGAILNAELLHVNGYL